MVPPPDVFFNCIIAQGIHGCYPCSLRQKAHKRQPTGHLLHDLPLKLQPGDLLPLEDVPLVHDLVLMVMPEEPVGELGTAVSLFPGSPSARPFRSRGSSFLTILLGAQWVRMQSTAQPARSRFASASLYSSALGSSSDHQDTPFTRNMARSLRISQYCRSKSGSAGSRMPSWISWEDAPPMVNQVRPPKVTTCPRIR